jgi:hypothetical protein
MQKYGYRRTAACMLCQTALEERGSSWKGELPSWSLQEVNVHGKADRHMRLLTIETESRLGTLWDQEECNQFARRKSCGKQREMKK